MVDAMRKEVLASDYIQADETPVDVQTHDKRGKNHQAYLWQYGTPGGGVVFDFRMSRGREGPARFLGNFEGILQTDDYIAYERGLGGPKMVHACCWSHSRRHFVDAVKLNKQDAGSIRAVELMDKLFLIDAEAREENMDHAARHLLRREKAPPLLDQIREHILATSKTVLPRSRAGQACNYTLALWKKLTCFLDYPQLELSNNLAENSMRGVALGRRNWIHIGSQEAGPKIAAIISVVESCRRLKIPVREYLADILPGLANTLIQRVAELTRRAHPSPHRPRHGGVVARSLAPHRQPHGRQPRHRAQLRPARPAPLPVARHPDQLDARERPPRAVDRTPHRPAGAAVAGHICNRGKPGRPGHRTAICTRR